jgi:hypothetical protein
MLFEKAPGDRALFLWRQAALRSKGMVRSAFAHTKERWNGIRSDRVPFQTR